MDSRDLEDNFEEILSVDSEDKGNRVPPRVLGASYRDFTNYSKHSQYLYYSQYFANRIASRHSYQLKKIFRDFP